MSYTGCRDGARTKYCELSHCDLCSQSMLQIWQLASMTHISTCYFMEDPLHLPALLPRYC